MNNPGKPKVFYILTLLLILLFTLTAAFILYQTFSKKKKPAPAASLPQTETATKPAAPIPSPSSAPAKPGILNPAQPQITSSIIIESTTSGRIKGKLNIENASDQGLNDLYYDLYLRYPEIQTPVERGGKKIAVISQGALLAYFESKSFTLNAKEKKSLLFELSFSPNLNPGSYKLQAFTITKDGQVTAGINTQLALGQDKAFLELKESSCKLFVGEKEFAPNIGPNVDPGQSPIGRCQLTNPTSKTIRAKVAVDWAVRHVMNYPASEKLHLDSNEIITLAPYETKTVAMPLPAQSTPQVYEAYTILLNEQNQPVSAVIPFRWIIRGPSAYIKEATLDKDFYLKGETAKVSALISPSMDLFWRPATQSGTAQEGTDLTNAKLAVRITTDKGILCGSGEKQLPSTSQNTNWNSEQIQVKIEGECINPKVEAQIVNNNQSLAELSHQIRTSGQSIQNLRQKGQLDNKQLLAAITILVIIGLAIFIFLRTKRKGNPPQGPVTTLMILMAVGAILNGLVLIDRFNIGSKTALAYTVYPPTGTESSRLWVRGYTNTIGGTDEPIFGDFWLSGSSIRQTSNNTIEVNFTGQLSGLLCANDAPGFQLSNYITDSSNGSTQEIAAISLGPSSETNNFISGTNIVETVHTAPDPSCECNENLNNAPISITYTITTTNNLPAGYNFRIDQKLVISPTDFTDVQNYHYSTDENYPGDTASFLYYNNPLQSPLSDGRQWCGGGAGTDYVPGITIPGCMGRVEVSGNMSASCPAPGTSATLTFSIPGATSYNLNVGTTTVNNASSPYSFISSAGSIYNWGVAACNPSGSCPSISGPAFTCSSSSGPAISSLQIGNADPNQTVPSPGASPFVGTSKTAGLTRTEGGSNWLNPMAITLNANGSDGQPNSTIKEYYVAFYNKASGLASATSTTNFLTDIQGRLNADPKNGFLLRYDTNVPTWYVWKVGAFQQVTSLPSYVTIYDNIYPYLPILNISRGSSARSWKVELLKAFGSKSLYTGASVVDNNTLTNTQAEIPTTP